MQARLHRDSQATLTQIQADTVEFDRLAETIDTGEGSLSNQCFLPL